MLHSIGRSADHHTVPFGKAPDAAACSHVDELGVRLRQHCCAPDGVLIVAVAAVDDDIAGIKNWKQLLEHTLHGAACRNHNPQNLRSPL